MSNESPESTAGEVRCERFLPAERKAVWSALCHAEGLERWLADEVELEVRPGAEGTLRWQSGEERRARVEEVEERRRLTLRWCEPGGEPSLVELTLDDAPGGTRLVVVEIPLETLHAIAGRLEGQVLGAVGPQMSAGVTGPSMLAAVA